MRAWRSRKERETGRGVETELGRQTGAVYLKEATPLFLCGSLYYWLEEHEARDRFQSAVLPCRNPLPSSLMSLYSHEKKSVLICAAAHLICPGVEVSCLHLAVLLSLTWLSSFSSSEHFLLNSPPPTHTHTLLGFPFLLLRNKVETGNTLCIGDEEYGYHLDTGLSNRHGISLLG